MGKEKKELEQTVMPLEGETIEAATDTAKWEDDAILPMEEEKDKRPRKKKNKTAHYYYGY